MRVWLGITGSEVDVEAVVGVFADLLEKQLDEFRGPLAGPGHQLHEEEAAEDAVPLRDVALERVAAAFFSSRDRLLRDHRRPNELETDGRHMDGHVVQRSEFVDHRALREGANDRPPQALAVQLVEAEHREGGERVDECAVLVQYTETIGIAIVCDHDIETSGARGLDAWAEVGLDRFGLFHAGERGVPLSAHLLHVRADAVQRGADEARPRTVHGVHADAQSGRSDRPHVNDTRQVREVGSRHLDGLRLRSVPSGRIHASRSLESVYVAFDPLDDLRRRTASVVGLVLEAVPQAGVMAGRDDDAAARLPVEDVVADDWCRGNVIREKGGNAVGCDDSGSLCCKLRRTETGVIADDGPALAKPLVFQVSGDSRRADPHVLERIVPCDEGSPAVGAEPDQRFVAHRAAPSFASARRASALSVRSQGRSTSIRPKWP